MESQLYTLSKIFTERLFRIPDYQRGYAWTEKQLSAFWADLDQLGDKTNHYTGVLTLEAVTPEQWDSWNDDRWIIESRRYEPLFVVDGQQRLTTSIILIQCILESTPEDEKLNYTSKIDIQRKFVFDTREEGVSRSYLFGYEVDNPSYEFLKTKIFNEFSSESKSEETIYTNNLEFAKSYFSEKLSGMNKSEIEAVYRKLTQQLLFNIFSISSDVDVCVAFETMNNRGKPLSELELLKNRLIYLSLKIDETEHERKALRKSINNCWKAIYHNLGRNKKRPLDDDTFLSSHYLLYFTNIDKAKSDENDLWMRRRYWANARSRGASYKTLLEEVFVSKRVSSNTDTDGALTLKGIYKYVSALQPAVERWYQIFNPESLPQDDQLRPWLDKLNRLQSTEHLPLQLAVLLCSDPLDDKVEILKKLEQLAFISRLVDQHDYYLYVTSGDFTIEAIGLYRETLSAKQVSKALAEHISRITNSKEFMSEVRKRFRSNGFYNWRQIRYFLYEYNLHLQSRSKTERKKLDWHELAEQQSDYITVEHIFPQQARAPYWRERFSHMSVSQRKSAINSLGNLVPLSRSKNSSLSNKPFPEKVTGDREKLVGFRYGCYAENEVAAEREWTPHAILARGEKLLGFMERRWNLNFGSREEKISMLGLDFIELDEA